MDKLIERGFPPEKLAVVHHYTEFADITPAYSRNDGYILYFGRLAPVKGVFTLLRAMKRFPKLQLRIAGDGPQRPQLTKYVESEGLHNVQFEGQLPFDILRKLIEKSMFVVVPSEFYETFGFSTIESFAFGKPVIASKLGALSEIVEDNKNGLHFEPQNVDALSEKIELLSNPPKIIERLGRQARVDVETKFSPEQHYRNVLKIYSQLL